MYEVEVMPSLSADFDRLARKAPEQLAAIHKKLPQILENPHHFKPLRGHLHGLRRAHIMGSFVLLFSIDESRKKVVLVDYAHHDDAYRR